MLQPKRTKFRKQHKGRIKGVAKGGSDLNFGTYGLKALEPERVTARQIEAARRAMTRHMKRQVVSGSVFSRMYLSPQSPSKFVWVKVKVPWIVGSARSSQAVLCSKSTVSPRTLHKKLCVLPR